jgi:hypothetical protein
VLVDDVLVDVFAVVEADVDEIDILDELSEADGAAAARTRNPGLDSSPVFRVKVFEATLKRRTYFALKVRLLFGI